VYRQVAITLIGNHPVAGRAKRISKIPERPAATIALRRTTLILVGNSPHQQCQIQNCLAYLTGIRLTSISPWISPLWWLGRGIPYVGIHHFILLTRATERLRLHCRFQAASSDVEWIYPGL